MVDFTCHLDDHLYQVSSLSFLFNISLEVLTLGLVQQELSFDLAAATMLSLLSRSLLCISIFLVALGNTQSASTSGYVGYNLTLEGDENSVVYSTDDTRPNAAINEPDPDVYLNASGTISRSSSVMGQLLTRVQCMWVR